MMAEKFPCALAKSMDISLGKYTVFMEVRGSNRPLVVASLLLEVS